MRNLLQDGIYLLFGLTMTLAVLGAIGTIGGVIAAIVMVFLPKAIALTLQAGTDQRLSQIVLVASLLQILGWYGLLRIGFVSRRVGQTMLMIMSGITLFMFAMVLFSL